MAIKGSELLSYRGDAALAGAGRGVATPDFSELTQSARDFALMNFQANQMQWRQRQQDRDKLFQAIDENKISLDNILEKDRPEIMKKVDAYYEVFSKNGFDVRSNPKLYHEMQKKYAEADAAIKQAQKKYAAIEAERIALGKETNTARKKQREENLARMIDSPYTDIPMPYSPIIDFDLNDVQPPPVFGSPVTEGLKRIQRIDPDATMAQYRRNWSLPEKREMFDKFINTVNQEANPQGYVDNINEKLKRLSQQSGVKVDPIEYVRMPNGQIQFRAMPWEVAAKIRMADEADWMKEEFAKQEADYRIDLQKDATTRRGQNIDAAIANNRIAADLTKAGWKKDDKGNWSYAGLPGVESTSGGNYWQSVIKPQLDSMKVGVFRKTPVASNYTGDLKISTEKVSGLGIALFGEKNEEGKDIGYTKDRDVRIRYENGVPLGVVIDGVFYNEDNVNTKAVLLDNRSVSTKIDNPNVTIPGSSSTVVSPDSGSGGLNIPGARKLN